jgi:4,5-dihydroxyphthalate decarboxylase
MTGAPLELSLATWDHDRALPLHDGRVRVPGVTFQSHILPTTQLFPLAVQEARFDVTELSLSSYLLQLSQGTSAYTAIPAFLSRAFRHGGYYGRAGSGIGTPADLAGKRVGVPEYQMTAALWMRGILADEYGVDPSRIHWRTGALDEGVRHERLALELPEGMQVMPIRDGETLQQLLLDGQLDGLLAPKPPQAWLDGDPRIRRLVADPQQAEHDWHARTGFFPIMHVVALRRTLAEAHPWLPMALYEGFVAARDLATARLRDVWLGSANRVSLPWLGDCVERTLAAFGPDWWSYGFAANRAELDTVARYSREQHLAVRRLEPEEMFHASVLST